MKKIGCLIVDDEPIAREILKTYIGRLPELSLLGGCKNVTEAYETLHQLPVDVIFLDVQMPVTSGITFLRSLQRPPLIIFTTAYSEHAVEGFELNAIDYLLKPITFERFYLAIQRVKDRLSEHTKSTLQEMPSYIFIRQDTKLIKVDFEDICYIQAERDFCSVYLTNGKRLLASMHLKIIDDILPAEKFIRVHRSYIINTNKIKAIQGNKIEMGNVEIPIGNSYRENLLRFLHL